MYYAIIEQDTYKGTTKLTLCGDKQKAWRKYCNIIADIVENGGGDKYAIQDACSYTELDCDSFCGQPYYVAITCIQPYGETIRVRRLSREQFLSEDYCHA